MSTGKQTTYTELADVLDRLPMLCREARRARGLSLRSAAIEVGCGFNTLTRFEHGSSDVRLSNAAMVMRWLDQVDHAEPEASDTTEAGL